MALMQRLKILNSIKRIRLTNAINIRNIENRVSLQALNKFSYSVCTNITYRSIFKRLTASEDSHFHHTLSTAPNLEFVTIETKGDGNKIGIITINRPQALNALNECVVHDICNAMVYFDNDPNVGAIILTGSEKAFVAGADIKEMEKRENFSDVLMSKMVGRWDLVIGNIKKPMIAAVNGFALGGGCELAMMCDIIVAGEKAKFGQPEINLGIIPGGGGTQRLTHAIGKSRAMQLCLTGDIITAQQAEAWGLVSSVHPTEELLEAAIDIGNKIAKKSKLIAQMVKESVNNASELSLEAGLKAERRICYSTFATADRKEGMEAFVEKRQPNFTDK